MKIWNSYKKELKIASRGFYFYMEIIIAVILLAVLLFAVPENPVAKGEEVIFMDMPHEEYVSTMAIKVNGSGNEKTESTEFKLKPATIVYYDEQTGEKFEKTYDDKKTVSLDTYNFYDVGAGRVTKIKYVTDNFDDMLRITYAKKLIGTRMWYGEDGLDYYENILFGTETERFKNLAAFAHGSVDAVELAERTAAQSIRLLEAPKTLNNRQMYIPLVVVMMNGLMGIMVLIAYISVDKSEGLIKALAVTPPKTSHYLTSKILVVLTTSLLSTLAITIPIMGLQPNYPLFLLTAVVLTVLSCTIGLIIASFFSDIKSSFGVIIMLTLLLVLPVMTSIVPSFSPAWMKLFPTYYMLEAIEETLLPHPDIVYILLANAGMAVAAIVFFLIAEKRYNKILSI